MLKIQNIKREIISGAIVSIVLFFGQSIGLYLWQALLKFSINTYSGFIDGIYLNAALGQRNWIDFLSFSLLVYIIIYSLLKKSLKINEMINDIKIERQEKSEIKKRENQILKNYKAKAFLERHIQKFKFIVILMNITICFLSTTILFIIFIDLQLNTSFNQQINTLSPYIDEQKEELFKSKWALMKDRKDYEVIIKDLEKTASENNIKLPNLLVK
ncbi:hypothetical protein [Flavobacterium sp. C3NV]|uniref:hypothetical protein n=1 Tax=Flavobacterium sp. C3NV TaxID=3393358 RepID=UPI0039902623